MGLLHEPLVSPFGLGRRRGGGKVGSLVVNAAVSLDRLQVAVDGSQIVRESAEAPIDAVEALVHRVGALASRVEEPVWRVEPPVSAAKWSSVTSASFFRNRYADASAP